VRGKAHPPPRTRTNLQHNFLGGRQVRLAPARYGRVEKINIAHSLSPRGRSHFDHFFLLATLSLPLPPTQGIQANWKDQNGNNSDRPCSAAKGSVQTGDTGKREGIPETRKAEQKRGVLRKRRRSEWRRVGLTMLPDRPAHADKPGIVSPLNPCTDCVLALLAPPSPGASTGTFPKAKAMAAVFGAADGAKAVVEAVAAGGVTPADVADGVVGRETGCESVPAEEATGRLEASEKVMGVALSSERCSSVGACAQTPHINRHAASLGSGFRTTLQLSPRPSCRSRGHGESRA